MRQTLKETPSIKDAFDEIKRLDDAFSKAFNRNSKVDLFIFSVGDPRVQLKYGITMEWDNKNQADAEFYMNAVEYLKIE